MRKLVLWLGIASIVLVFGCAQTARSRQEDLANADYGLPPKNYKHVIRESFRKSLFDYSSAQIEFKAPEKAWRNISKNVIGKATFQYLWRVPVEVNAKNRFGAYVGWKTYYVYYKDGVFITIEEPYSRY